MAWVTTVQYTHQRQQQQQHSYYIMSFFRKDGTAQGVAKVRHYESLLPTEQQLYHDPYAYGMFPGSYIQYLMGPKCIQWMYRVFGLGGLIEMISVRTRWLDDQVIKARRELLHHQKECKNGQLIILGAGYDTRGFRLLDLWNGSNDSSDNDTTTASSTFHVIEVDQPEVQEKKVKNMQWLMTKETNDSNNSNHTIAHLMESKQVSFLPVNFVTDNLQEKLTSHEQFSSSSDKQNTTLSIITMEGVTQYIPKESTADTLKKMHNIVSVGSTLLITYVDQDCFGATTSTPPSSLSVKTQNMMQLVSKVGEPWITGFTPGHFASFLQQCGYQVQSDTTLSDYNEEYLGVVGRKLSEEEMICAERFVVANVI